MKRFIFYWNEGYIDGPILELKNEQEIDWDRYDDDIPIKVSDLTIGETLKLWGIVELHTITRVDDYIE